MKAVLLKGYGDVNELVYGDAPDPRPGVGQLLVRVRGTSVNPVDWKIREGALKDMMPVEFPAILGRDVAGEVFDVGEGVTEFKRGDKVMALTMRTYSEYVVDDAKNFARIPEGLSMEQAGVLPLVLLTGAQLIEEGVKPSKGETVLVTGAVGSVGRTAVYVAKQHGAKVIAGVRKNQLEEAKQLGAHEVVALDDVKDAERLQNLTAIADTVGPTVTSSLVMRLRGTGRLFTVLQPPENNRRDVQVGHVWAHPDARRLHDLAQDLKDGKFQMPIKARFKLSEIREAQKKAEEGGTGKVAVAA